MTSIDPAVVRLQAAFAQLARLTASVSADQAGLATPCQEWSVGQLLDHLCSDLSHFQLVARGESPDWSQQIPSPGPGWAQDIADNGAALVEAWQQAGDLSGRTELPGIGEVPATFRLDMQTVELVCHGWDLARAMGEGPLDDALAEAALSWMKAALSPQFRTPQSGFGAERDAPSDAGPYERLAAFSGRDPQWTPER